MDGKLAVGAIAVAAAGIAASPLIWNIVARNEYRNHTLERAVGGKRRGCYVLAAWIFGSSLVRDYLYGAAIAANPGATIVGPGAAGALSAAGWASGSLGTVLVLSAYYRLGITGTYLGDYFGLLMPARVTAFPFSHFEHPMYLGSTLCFLALALRQNSLVGVGLTAWVWAVYWVSTTKFEGPFTSMIYAEAAKKKQQKS